MKNRENALKSRGGQQFGAIASDKEFGFLTHCFPGNHIRLDILLWKIQIQIQVSTEISVSFV